eukprot:s57_g21.t1
MPSVRPKNQLSQLGAPNWLKRGAIHAMVYPQFIAVRVQLLNPSYFHGGMKRGPISTALLCICWACQVQTVLGSRPSRDILKVLSMIDDDPISRSQTEEPSKLESGPADHSWNFEDHGDEDEPSTLHDDQINRSHIEERQNDCEEDHLSGALDFFVSGPADDWQHFDDEDEDEDADEDGHECETQAVVAQLVLDALGITSTEGGDHCKWPGIRCNLGCEVTGIDLSGNQEVHSDLDSTTLENLGKHYLEDLLQIQHLNLSDTKVRGEDLLFFIQDLEGLSSVDLSNTMIEGDIDLFRNAGHLTYLDLSGTQVFGDIRVFSSNKLKADGANMTMLQHLNLAHTKVSGDIKVFQHSPILEYLNLQATQASGDIEYLRVSPFKQILLRDTGVGGNIRVFQAFPGLIDLDLQNTLVFGDIRALEAAQKTQGLWLGATSIFGDIAAFQRTQDLQELDLSLTDVSGDIQVFQHTKLLTKMALDRTQVEGDVQVFRHVPELISLRLASTKVKGDIGIFNTTNSLVHLHISDTQVSGDLLALKNRTTLKKLYLRNSRVHGNLSALQSAVDLHELDLSDTQIKGDISVFEKHTSFFFLGLSSTLVTGDIAVFGRCFELSSLDLSFSNVTGDIQVFKGRESLKKLRMASTGVSGDLGVLVCSCSINAFDVIDLSATKVQGNIFVLQHAAALRELYLQHTQVAGSIDGITFLERASVVDLSSTRVTGRLTHHWRGCCKHLRILKLSGSRAHFLPDGADLTRLMDLRDGDQDILLPALTTLEVSDCPLNGELRFLIWPLAYCEHLGSIIAVNCGLYGELPNLDPLGPIRMNGIVRVGESSRLASSLEVLELSGNKLTLIESIPPSVRKLVISSNRKPLRLAEGTLTSALKQGVSIDLSGSKLEVGTQREARGLLEKGVISRTAEKTFTGREKDGFTCYDLERNSTTLQVLGLAPNAQATRPPGASWAPSPRATANAKKRFINTKVAKYWTRRCAIASQGTPFLMLECFPPLERERCRGGTLFQDHCGEGYHGRLCMQCKEKYYAASGSCVECTGVGLPSWLAKTMTCVSIGALLAAFLVAIAFFVYSWSPSQWLEGRMKGLTRAIFAPGALGDWQQQLVKRQAPILLQMCQLWSVLSALLTRDDEASTSFWELPYMQHVQLAVGNLREILYLQCFFDGKEVRKLLAFAMPVAPLLLLLCCVCVEVCKPGSGVNAALKILTLFFVGGASKCAALISCQRVDAGGYPLRDHFLRHLPDLDCSHNSMVPPEVAAVFWPCAVCYAILIPCFLFYLYVRQHLVLRYTRMPLELSCGSKSEPLAVSHEELALQRRLVAGLVAYVAILQQGSVRVQVRDGKGTVAFFDKPDGTALELDAEAINAQFKIESEKLRHHSITEMLLERFTLEQVREDDRFLLGSKETLLKYSTCRDSWMEVMLKLVTVAIVQAVASSTATNNLLIPMGKVLAATLAVAATVWSVQPYAQPQVNDLQVVCFLGLALAAAGFGYHNVFLSRLALLMPLVLAAAQQMQPDSPESLAQRLWEELVKDGMPTESATTSMLTKRQSQAIRFKLERG